MRALLAPLEELGEYEEIKKMLVSKQACVALSGCVDSQKLHMVYGIGDGFRNKIIVTFSDLRAKELYEDYKFYDRKRAIPASIVSGYTNTSFCFKNGLSACLSLSRSAIRYNFSLAGVSRRISLLLA